LTLTHHDDDGFAARLQEPIVAAMHQHSGVFGRLNAVVAAEKEGLFLVLKGTICK